MKYPDRPRISLLIPFPTWWYYTLIIKGAVAACREHKANLRIFTGSLLHQTVILKTQRKVEYELISTANSDGIISPTGAMFTMSTTKEHKNYFKRFSPLPIVNIGAPVEGTANIEIDNKVGMSGVVCHLIETHGYRKIAFLGGPKSNHDARVRLDCYKKVLAGHNIDPDPDYILYGDFTWNCGKSAVKALLDQKKPAPEAIVCASDEMALGVYEELNRRGIRIPGDIALTGFDNIQPTAHTVPPITTVKQPIFEQGAAAVELLLKMIDTKKIPEQLVLPTEIVFRQSCGCRDDQNSIEAKAAAEKLLKSQTKELNPVDTDPDLTALIEHNYCFSDSMKQKALKLHRAFVEEIQGNKMNDRFLGCLRKTIYHSKITREELNRWHRIIALTAFFYKNRTDKKQIADKIEIKLLQAEKLKLEIENLLIGSARPFDAGRFLYHYNIRKLGECLHLEELLDRLSEVFKGSGFHSFYLALYENEKGTLPVYKDYAPAPRAKMLIGNKKGEIVHYGEGINFLTEELVPGGRFTFQQENIFIIYPLRAKDFHYGYIMFEYDENEIESFQSIYEHLCTVLDTIKHIKDVEKTNKELDSLNKNLEKKVHERTIDLEKANEKLKEMDRVKTNFFSNISHELRTPLTLILSPLESFAEGQYGSSLRYDDEKIHSVLNNGRHLLRLINTLLDFSKIEAGRMQIKTRECDMIKMLTFIILSFEPAARNRDLTLEFDGGNSPVWASVDPDLIEKALYNLLSNALKFTPPGGNITVRLETSADEDFLTIRVCDTGIGIPREKQDSIFDRFTQIDNGSTRKYEGTGIGLAFVKEIAELHEGSINVESKSGEGSTFTLVLPKLAGEKTADSRGRSGLYGMDENPAENRPGLYEQIVNKNHNLPDVTEDKTTKEASILIVDDNRDMRDFIRGLLKKKYLVHTAIHGENALEIIAANKPDLIITDVMMPGIDGLTLCRILKEKKETAGIPIILLTARVDMPTRIEGLENRADEYLNKPFNARELFARINNLLEKRRLEQHLRATTRALWSEMEIARKIQSSLLPEAPSIPGFDLTCFIKSASRVSGDYYDVIRSGGRFWLVIGDVSGHGVTAGLVMMMVQTAIKSLLLYNPAISPSRMLCYLNTIIKNNICKLGQEKYMTITVFTLIEKSRFLYSGLHQDIFIYRAASKTVDILETSGMWIGFIDNIGDLVKDETFTLAKGDTLLLYTDGITEAVRKEWVPGEPGKRFGETKLLKLLKQHGHKKPDLIKGAIKDELEHYICDDDFTFVVLQKTDT